MFDRIADPVEDLDALVSLALDGHPGSKVFLVGHSMGGTIAIEYALAHGERLAGLALSAPLASVDAASPIERLAARLVGMVAPGLGLLDVDSGLISRDSAVVEAYDADPLVHHGRIPARTINVLAEAIETFPHRVARLRIPLLVMIGTEDALAPTSGGKTVYETAASADKTLTEYEGLYHEIFNEPDQDRVLGDLVAWLDARC